MENQQNELREAIVFSMGNLEQEGRILFCPIYLCGWLKKELDLPVLSIPEFPEIRE